MTPKKWVERTPRRVRGHRNPKERFLIVCQGRETEPLYFNSLKKRLNLTSVVVERRGQKENREPIDIVIYAKRLKDEVKSSCVLTEYDKIWCVIDVEAMPHASLDEAIKLAHENEIEVILSNPCFEYWYILHFKKISPLFNSSTEVERKLKTYYKKYKKNTSDILQKIFPLTEKAIKNSIAV